MGRDEVQSLAVLLHDHGESQGMNMLIAVNTKKIWQLLYESMFLVLR